MIKQKGIIKILCGILVFLIIFQCIMPIVVFAVEGENAQQTQANFLDFYNNSDNIILEAKNLTSQDYYVLSAFMSNWYKPGVTTLADLMNANSDFLTTFTSDLSKSGNNGLINTIIQIGTDTMQGLNMGTSVLLDEKGYLLTGPDFLDSLLDTYILNGSSKVYFGNKSQLAFDFSEPTFHAAFQVVAAYCPELFLMKEGIESIDIFFLDSVGNIWGGKKKSDQSSVNLNEVLNYKDVVKNIIGIENLYIILPACLNPATFTSNAKQMSDLKMPLINRFTLGCMVDIDDFKDIEGNFSFQKENIPFYNLLSPENIGVGSDLNKNLAIYGVQSISPFIKGLRVKSEKWGLDKRNQDLANFLYSPSLITMNKSSTTGVGTFGTESYIVFSPNLSAVLNLSDSHTNGNLTTYNKSVDLNNSISFIVRWSNNYAFSTFSESTIHSDVKSRLFAQQELLQYLYTPIFLNLNQISMNLFYRDNLISEVTKNDNLSNGLAKILYNYENEQEILASKMGMRGLNLFFEYEGEMVKLSDNDVYMGIVADNMIASKMVKPFLENSNDFRISLENYKEMQKGNINNIDFSGFSNSEINCESIIKNIFDAGKEPKFIYGFSITNWGLTDRNWVDLESDKNSDGILTPEEFENAYYYIRPHNFINLGSSFDGVDDITISRGSSYENQNLNNVIADELDDITRDDIEDICRISFSSFSRLVDSLIGYFGYSIFTPSSAVINTIAGSEDINSYSLLGSQISFTPSLYLTSFTNGDLMMGAYFGYVLDMMGISTCQGISDNSTGKLTFKEFNSIFLPKFNVSAKGGEMTFEGVDIMGSGVINSSDLSFEKKQEDLINRIYGLTNDSNNDYRNNLIKNILEGFILTVHRTITGTWFSTIDTVTTGTGSTYQSVTGYVYTPTLEELSFTAPLMNNYMQIYVFCMIIIIFILILMVLLHMRTWQQGMLIGLFMSIGLLFPYILISNSVNISNAVSNSVYSDRFDFWALIQQQQSLRALNSAKGMNIKDRLLTITSVADNSGIEGSNSVRIKWMAPKKVEMFQSLYSDADLSESFVTNMEIFKWLFSSRIYDSEFVDTEKYGSYLYRPYNSIVSEARSYAGWVKSLLQNSEYKNTMTYQDKNSFYEFNNLPMALVDSLNSRDARVSSLSYDPYLAVLIGYDESYYNSGESKLLYSTEKVEDIKSLRASTVETDSDIASKIGIAGSLNSYITERIYSDVDTSSIAGIISNLPATDSPENFENADIKEISKAIFLKNTESPFYYFYTVLRAHYSSLDLNSSNHLFKRALLDNNMFKITKEEIDLLNNPDIKLNNTYRDFLDLEGLFTYIIPYMNESNEYVARWREKNGSDIETYNFEYNVEKDGSATVTDDKVSSDYIAAVDRKNNMNRVWNMYSPWVDSLYDLDVYNKRVLVGGQKLVIPDTLNPSAYISVGRPMIFSEADMIEKGYAYKDLTDVERKIQVITEKTYEDLLYLINYYDLDDDVLIGAAAMYATFHFNQEFSQKSFLGNSVMLYPQSFELKNFNYDAFMRLALLNSTGESVFGTSDLYTTILSKTSIFTGLLLLVSDLVACVLIPLFKFIILTGLLFLGVLICIACVINPPEKIFESINKSLLLPTVLFMALNTGFAWIMSFVVGEGLTSYVGSKGINFATNDPTITILIIALLGIAYSFFAFKILKFLIEAYKQFGMSTVLAAVGIVGAALAKGTAGVAKGVVGGGLGTIGGLVRGGVGLATGEKGHRLSNAYEMMKYGMTPTAERHMRENRMARTFAKGKDTSESSRDKINDLAKTDGSKTSNKIDVKEKYSNNKGYESENVNRSGNGNGNGNGNRAGNNGDTGYGIKGETKETDKVTESTNDRFKNFEKAAMVVSGVKAKAQDRVNATKSGFRKVSKLVSNPRETAVLAGDALKNKGTEALTKGKTMINSKVQDVKSSVKAGRDAINSKIEDAKTTVKETRDKAKNYIGTGVSHYKSALKAADYTNKAQNNIKEHERQKSEKALDNKLVAASLVIELKRGPRKKG